MAKERINLFRQSSEFILVNVLFVSLLIVPLSVYSLIPYFSSIPWAYLNFFFSWNIYSSYFKVFKIRHPGLLGISFYWVSFYLLMGHSLLFSLSGWKLDSLWWLNSFESFWGLLGFIVQLTCLESEWKLSFLCVMQLLIFLFLCLSTDVSLVWCPVGFPCASKVWKSAKHLVKDGLSLRGFLSLGDFPDL